MSNTERDDRHSSKIVVRGPRHAGSIGQRSVPSTPTNATSLLQDGQTNSRTRFVQANTSTDAQSDTNASDQTTNKSWRRRLLSKWRSDFSTDIETGRRQSRPVLPREMDQDELFLAMTGYNQVFDRILRPMDNFFAMLSTMGLTTAMPAILSLVSIFTGGPKAALVNWLIVGFFSVIFTLCLGEIAASMPTSAGLYFYSYKLGGPDNGPFLAWITAWLTWFGWLSVVPGTAQITSNFLLSVFRIHYPTSSFVTNPGFSWVLILITFLVFILIPNVMHPSAMKWIIRGCCFLSLLMVLMYLFWFPVVAAKLNGVHPEVMLQFANYINNDNMIYAENAYVWVVAAILPAWVFKGYEVSIHLSEETKHASRSVAKGMYTGVLITYLLGIPILILIFACAQDDRLIVNASRTLPLAFAEYLLQILGHNQTLFVLVIGYINAALGTSILFMSAQRLTFALARDSILPAKKWITRISKRKLPINAGIVVTVYSLLLSLVSVSSASAFQAVLTAAVVAQNLSYAIVIFSRLVYGHRTFRPASWNLGRMSLPLNILALCYTGYIFLVLILPARFPVKADNFNFAPIAVIIILLIAMCTWAWPKRGARKTWKGPRTMIASDQLHGVRLVDVPRR